MDKQQIELTYTVSVDENGVVDGRELAFQLMKDAVWLLAFYAKRCRSCTGALFGHLGDTLFAELDAGQQKRGELSNEMVLMLGSPGEEERQAASMAHFVATRTSTQELLKAAGASGQHPTTH